jgi:hypothetical protein
LLVALTIDALWRGKRPCFAVQSVVLCIVVACFLMVGRLFVNVLFLVLFLKDAIPVVTF